MTYHKPIHLGGGLYYFSAIIRFPETGHPEVLTDDTHATIGVEKALYADGGVRIYMVNPEGVDRMEICHGTIQGDETVTGKRGQIAGPTGGSGGAFTARFFDTVLNRPLDLDVVADRHLLRASYANIWFECTRLDVNHPEYGG